MRISIRLLAIAALISGLPAAYSAVPEGGDRLATVDHYVRVHSTVPSLNGQFTQVYVREVVSPGTILREGAGADKVVLFVHGAGTPAEVSFDVPYQDYSWMGYLARAGFDVFSMDMTGYGRSTRPTSMNDPCNLSKAQQAAFVPGLIAAPCAPSYAMQATTIASDWNDIDAVVNHLLTLRHVTTVNMVAWSLGGPRAGGYTTQHADKVRRLVLLAPAYNRTTRAAPPEKNPAEGAAMTTQTRDEFDANWDRQVGCPAQYEPPVSDAVWAEMLASDPVGATWGTGVRRAPQVTNWGWTQDAVSKMKTPTLAVSGKFDKQVPQDRVREFYQDLGSTQKVFIDLACSSHNAMWEKNHLLLFRASLEWLTKGTVNGMEQGTLSLGN